MNPQPLRAEIRAMKYLGFHLDIDESGGHSETCCKSGAVAEDLHHYHAKGKYGAQATAVNPHKGNAQ